MDEIGTKLVPDDVLSKVSHSVFIVVNTHVLAPSI